MSVYSDYVLISNFFYQKSDFCKKIAQNIAVFLKLSKKKQPVIYSCFVPLLKLWAILYLD